MKSSAGTVPFRNSCSRSCARLALALSFVVSADVLSMSTGEAGVLKGRIEQVSGNNEPRLPELRALSPKLDTSAEYPLRTIQSGASKTGQALFVRQALAASYPINWQGDWFGDLTIMDARYAQPLEPALRDEVELERRANARGRKGKAKFSFRLTPPKEVSLEPVTIRFVYPSDLRLPDPVLLSSDDAARLVAKGERTDDVTFVPNGTYCISMNNLGGGLTVGGSIVAQRVLRNSVSRLAVNVIEQDIITRTSEKLHDVQHYIVGYNEDVLRFTMIDAGTILVQSVTLAYSDQGHCNSKLSFSGYVRRH